MEPPGKRLGCTTNESVDIAIRSPLGKVSTAPSPSDSSVGLRNASTNTASTSAAEALPPAPWARVTWSSTNRGRRLRNDSIRSITSPSANRGPDERYSPADLLTPPPNFDRCNVRGSPTTADSPAALAIPESGARFANEQRSKRPHLGWLQMRRRR